MATVYVAQAQGGTGDGSSCANAKAVAFFNTGGNWGAGATQIGPGSTVRLCGTITTALTAEGSGTSASPITIQWEAASSLSVCDATGAFRIPGQAYLTLDLGANTAAITCPNNGTALATQVEAIGVSDAGSGFHNIEIRNGTIGPLYAYSGTANNGFDSTCINGTQNVASSHIHDLTLKGCAVGVNYSLGPSSSTNDEIDHLTTDTTVGRVINYASGADGSTYTSTNPKIHDLDVNYSTIWAVAGDYLHYEWIHVFNRGIAGSSDTISNLEIYDNYFHGTTPNNQGSTGGIFISEGGSNCAASSTLSVKIFNNLIVNQTGGIGFSSGSGGFIYEQDCEHTVEVYNNTIDGGDTSMNSCFELNGTTGSTWTVKNNVCMNTQFAFYNPQAGAPMLVADDNVFYNIKSGGNGGYEWMNNVTNTIAGWRTASGQDADSSTANPGLDATTYAISGTTSLAYQLGANLTSLNVAALDVDKAGVQRAATGKWDAGAYTFSTAPAPPSAPTGLTAVVH
jgi:hypothetical protein